MGWTKKQFITQAFEELGISASIYDLTPAQLESGANKLNAMMALWSSNGVKIGWAAPSTQYLGDINQDSLAPDYANEAIYTNLAVRLSSSFGKMVSPELRALATSSYSGLVSALSNYPMEMAFPSTMPLGAGSKPGRYQRQFFNQPSDPLLIDGGTTLDFE